MNKKVWFLFLLLPLLTASTIVVKDGGDEVAKVETHDGSAQKEVISENKLEEEAGGFTQLKEFELENTKKQAETAVPETLIAPPDIPRGNYGILEGMTEQEVQAIASASNMGSVSKSSEYLAGSTYPVRTWTYDFEDGGLKHTYKVFFDTDGKVLQADHQTEQI